MQSMRLIHWLGFYIRPPVRRVRLRVHALTSSAGSFHPTRHLPNMSPRKPCALLGNALPYEGESNQNLAKYDSTLISVPDAGSNPVRLSERIGDDARNLLVHFDSHLLLSDEDWGAVVENQTHVGTYTDPRLERSDRLYHDFVRRLHTGGLITFRRAPHEVKSRVGVFVVNKKDGRQRIVIDCRATNRRFKPTPHIPMGTGAAWADAQIDPDSNVFSLSLTSAITFMVYRFRQACRLISACATCRKIW